MPSCGNDTCGAAHAGQEMACVGIGSVDYIGAVHSSEWGRKGPWSGRGRGCVDGGNGGGRV